MKIITNGIKEIFIIYKMYDIINGKIYIGKTTIPIYMRINLHKHSKKLEADRYFSSIGWENVIFEVIDWSHDKSILLKKEDEQIRKHFKLYENKILNKYNTRPVFFHIPKDIKKLSCNYFE